MHEIEGIKTPHGNAFFLLPYVCDHLQGISTIVNVFSRTPVQSRQFISISAPYMQALTLVARCCHVAKAPQQQQHGKRGETTETALLRIYVLTPLIDMYCTWCMI